MNRGSDSAPQTKRRVSFPFNEAPIHESGKFGHVANDEFPPVPSMRPRFMNRGSQVMRADFHLQGEPSMRPRFMNRGSLED